jgi:mRNA interferase MazF
MAKGDIVLIPFPFTDLSGNKLRPAVVLIDSSFDLTVCFITSQIKWAESTDIEITPSALNGIKRQSLIRLGKIATIDKTLVAGKLGVLNQHEILDLNQKLKTLLKLH